VRIGAKRAPEKKEEDVDLWNQIISEKENQSSEPSPRRSSIPVFLKEKEPEKPNVEISKVENKIYIPELEQEITVLYRLYQENDYLKIFDIETTSIPSIEEITKKRRELTQKYHPDHYQNDTTAQAQASQALSRINEIFTNVFRQDSTRELYNRIITHRGEFKLIINMSQNQKVKAQAQQKIEQFNELRVAIKKANMPKSLIQELDQAVIVAQKL